MLGGALLLAAGIVLVLHVLFWKMRGIAWMPNKLVTFWACCVVVMLSAALAMTGSVHLIYLAIFTTVLGVPTFLLVNKYPQRERYLRNPRY